MPPATPADLATSLLTELNATLTGAPWNPRQHPRKEDGQFTRAPGGIPGRTPGTGGRLAHITGNTWQQDYAPPRPGWVPDLTPAIGVKALTSRGRPGGTGAPDDPIDVAGNIDQALILLHQGKHVRLNQVDEVALLLHKVEGVAKRAAAKGEKPPDWDFGLLTVKGTSLFTAQHRGIPRINMPQFSGLAEPGSKAARIAGGDGKFTDLTPQFAAKLKADGITVTSKRVPAAHLRATQTELVGSKVAGFAAAVERGDPKATATIKEPIYVTRDGYVIDGHHRWAANMMLDALDGILGNDTYQNVHMVDLDIGAAIPYANAFAADMGIAGRGGVSKKTAAELRASLELALTAAFNPAEKRDEHGRWTGGGKTGGHLTALPGGKTTTTPEQFSAAFSGAFKGSPYAAFVNHYTPAQIRAGHMRPLLSKDGKTGLLIHDHGDGRIEVTALFNTSPEKGAGLALARRAIREHGANYAECFGPVLPRLYQSLGFTDDQTYPFDPGQAPPGWDYQRFDNPAYHTMKLAKTAQVAAAGEQLPDLAAIADAARAEDPAWWDSYGQEAMAAARVAAGIDPPHPSPAGPAAAAGLYAVRENHPGCPPHRPHATTGPDGHPVMCHRTPRQAQDLALTLNTPDATPTTPGAVMDIGAASDMTWVSGLDRAGLDAALAAAEAAAPRTDRNRGNAETLRRYWSVGEGAAKIRWGTPGDHMRCVRELMDDAKFTEQQAHGYCVTGSARVLPARVVVPVDEPVTGPHQVSAAALAGPLRHFAGGKLRGTYERHYVGDVVTIRTSGGYELTVTPKHPVGTPYGWVPAAELAVGDDVLCSLSAERRMRAPGDHVEDVVPAIEEVAKALPLAFTTVTWPVDFHGDGPGSKVHVVRSDGLLMRDVDAAFREHPGELLLVSTDHGTRLARAGGLERPWPAASGDAVPLGSGGGLRVAGRSAQGNPGSGEDRRDTPGAGAGVPGDGDDGLAGQVALLDARSGESFCCPPAMPGGEPRVTQDAGDRPGSAAERDGDSGRCFPGPVPPDDGGLVDGQGLAAGGRAQRDLVPVQDVADRAAAGAQFGGDVLDVHAAAVQGDDGRVVVGAVADEPAGFASGGPGRADLDPALAEKLLNGSGADMDAARDFDVWLSGDVAARKVVSIHRGTFDGHVYDLSTDTGVFTGETVLLGPCNLIEKHVTGLYPAQHAHLEKTGHAAAGELPALVTIPGVDLLAAGTWQLSTGRQTFTRADLQAAIESAACPAVGAPLIKIGHLDPRFTPKADADGEPAVGRVANLRLSANGTKLVGDLAGMPGWLGAIAASAFPRRSVEGKYRLRCQIGHEHPFALTALALLGVTPPGVGVLSGLHDVASLYGLTASAPAGQAWHTEPVEQEEHVVPISEEDVRRAYYASAGAPATWWITELQMTPTQLIVADEADGKIYRVPFSISADAVTFGNPDEVASYEDVAATRGTGPVMVYASAAESRSVIAAWDAAAAVAAMGDNPPAGAIRAMFALPAGTKTASSLPHHECSNGQVGAANPDACSAAIGALNGARGGLKGASTDAKRAAYTHLAGHLKAAGRTPPEFTGAAPPTTGTDTSSQDPGQEPGSSVAGAATEHGPHTGTHSHPHPAMGAQGSDATHDHPHKHSNDAVHDHAHEPAAGAPAPDTTQGGGDSGMGFEFNAQELAAIRARLGKKDTDPLSASDIAAAFAAPPAPVAAAAAGTPGDGPVDVPQIVDGTYLVDGDILRGYQEQAVAGQRAVRAMHVAERDTILAAAIKDGKFPQARLEHFQKLWDRDPDGTRKLVEQLAAGLVPTGGPLGTAGEFGIDPDLPGDFPAQDAYRKLYPDDARGGASTAPGVRGGSRG